MTGKNRIRIFLTGILLFGLVQVGVAKELEISGFTDVLYQNEQEGNNSFGMGVFEIDFAYEFNPQISFEGAIAVEGSEIGIGQTLVDFKLLDEKLGVQAGLLDIPFGIDYQVFATPDRKLISFPLVTELMMDGGWGDVGVNLYGSLYLLNYNLYAVNGMGEDNGDPCNQLTDNNSGKTIGSRIGFSPAKDLEFGFSYTQGNYLDDNTKDILSRIGGDIQFAYEPLEIKGEFVKGKEKVPGAGKNKHEGYYIQLLVKATEKVYGVARYGYWKPEESDEVIRFTIGLGYELIENISLRAEYQINKETPEVDNDIFSTQMVINF